MEKAKRFERVFPACGRTWRIRMADMDRLWDEMGVKNGEERLPYWNEVWPSSLAMAGWLVEVEEDIRGKSCLDLGCGLGFTALVGKWLGAEVVGADYEGDALEYAAMNEKLNGMEGIRWEMLDWREPEPHRGRFDRIWASDVMYEKDASEPLAAFFSVALKPGGRAWLAEPGREVFNCFPEALLKYGMAHRRMCSLPVFPLTAQDVPVPVTIWEINRLAMA